MSDPYRRSPHDQHDRRAARFRPGRTLAVLAVAFGSIAAHAVDVPELRRAAELQRLWSEVATCAYGAPLAPGETPSSRVRRERIAASWRREPPRPPFGCDDAIEALIQRLDVAVPVELRFRTQLDILAHRRRDAEHDALFGAARALGLGHAVAVGPTPRLGPDPLVVSRVPPLHGGISSLEHVETTPVRGRAPAVLLASDVVPRICRWSTEREPLDRVSCWDVPASIPHGPPGVLFGATLIEHARPGGALILQTERPGSSARHHFDAQTGAVIPEDAALDAVARRNRRPSSWARDCAMLEGTWDDGARSIAAFEPDSAPAPPEVVLDQLGSGRQLTCGRGDDARITGLLFHGRIPGDVTLIDARCRGDQCSEERLPLLFLGPPRAELLRDDAIARADAVSLGDEIVVAMAHGEAGVVVRRAPMGRLEEEVPSLLIDDLGAPTRRVRLITDGRGVVLLLDDGQVVRALRQRPDGSWVPQVATTE